jgi:large subunit ribosomal protein L18
MARKMIQQVKFRRRREGVTDYKKRLELVKGGIERVVVRKSNKRIIAEIVQYGERGDKVVASVDSRELRQFNWPSRGNRSTAYLTGMLLAKKTKLKKEVILDIGITVPVKNSIPFVFAKGCIDGGMKLKGSIEIPEDVYNSTQTAKYAEMLKKDQAVYKKQFGGYTSEKVSAESLPRLFSEVKAKIQAM